MKYTIVQQEEMRMIALELTTNRTYFEGLLSSGGWKSDIIGMCASTLEYDFYCNECM
jgi:hypothetical protein